MERITIKVEINQSKMDNMTHDGVYLNQKQRELINSLFEPEIKNFLRLLYKTTKLSLVLKDIIHLLSSCSKELPRRPSIATLGKISGLPNKAVESCMRRIKANDELLQYLTKSSSTGKAIYLRERETKILTTLHKEEELRLLIGDILTDAEYDNDTLVYTACVLLQYDRGPFSRRNKTKVNYPPMTDGQRDAIILLLKKSGLWYCLRKK